ncbi:MAG: response regulator, partial [Burkholderiales bacterium]
MRILLVEDDALLGDGVTAGLGQADFVVDWTKDGISAEGALKGSRYDAVVLDLGLPRLCGLDLL